VACDGFALNLDLVLSVELVGDLAALPCLPGEHRQKRISLTVREQGEREAD